MGKSTGKAIFPDNTVLWFIYDGSVTHAIPTLADTRRQAWEQLDMMIHQTCTCGEAEPVTLTADYGSGKEWSGYACRHCYALTDASTTPYADDGLDDYFP